MKTTTTYDDSVDFASYKTFAQAPVPTSMPGLPGYNEITGRKIQQRIADNLQQKGLQAASWEDADLHVGFSLGGQPREQAEYEGGGWYGPGYVTTETHIQGSLVIDIADRAQNRLVWHGYGTEDLFSQPKSDDLVLRAVDAVLEKYPPSAESH